MIRLEGLSVRPLMKGKSALSEIDLILPARKIVGLVGPKGAGKAALLRVLGGGHKARAGRFYLDGEVLTPKALRWRQDVATVGAEASMPKSGRVLDHVLKALPRVGHGRRSQSLPEERVERVLRALELWDLAQGRFDAFSAAAAWRLAIAGGLLNERRCLLFEEPSSLPVEVVADSLRLLQPFAEGGVSCIVPTSLDLPSECFDELILIDGGRVLGTGRPQALAEAEQLPPQISIPRTDESEDFLDETIEEGFVWADGPNATFISALPEEMSVVEFQDMLKRQSLRSDFATLEAPSLGILFQAMAGRSLEE